MKIDMGYELQVTDYIFYFISKKLQFFSKYIYFMAFLYFFLKQNIFFLLQISCGKAKRTNARF